MEEELKQLKTVLRSLVVSSPAQVDVRSLMRDYRDMMGANIPLSKFGCRDPVSFLRKHFVDCFLFQGPESNPILTLIVPETLKHIDHFVQRQKPSQHAKMKGKRRSVNESTLNKCSENENRITKSFQIHRSISNKEQPISCNRVSEYKPATKDNNIIDYMKKAQDKNESENRNRSEHRRVTEYKPATKDNDIIDYRKKAEYKNESENRNRLEYRTVSEYKSQGEYNDKENKNYSHQNINSNLNSNQSISASKNEKTECKNSIPETKENARFYSNTSKNSTSDKENDSSNNKSSYNAYQSFVKKRMPFYNLEHEETIETFDKDDNSSGRPLSASTSSSKRLQLEELRKELVEMILQEPGGVWCTDLLRMYRNRYGRELNFTRFGFTSVLSLAYTLEECAVWQSGDDWLLRDARASPPRPPRPAPAHYTRESAPDPDDALPFIDYEPDVFPPDCLHLMESIPAPRLDGVEAGSMLEVLVGEVYSPSHFWLLRLGPEHNIAMEELMDDMNNYFKRGEGRERRLALGAARAGHYCSSCYLGDWHRSLIVKVLDGDTVKVRHVDYGTVETVCTAELRPLRREWAVLPAQALRARLAAVRPPAAAGRWPRAAAARFLAAVTDRRLVANVVARDPQEDILEVLLIDTSTEEDLSIGDELVRSGHADGRADVATGTAECYLYPRFEALEGGDTPNYAEIHAYLRDGIALEYVHDYRRHVPLCPPARPAPPPPPPPPPLPPPLTHVPLLTPTLEQNLKSRLHSLSTIALRPMPPTALVNPSPVPRLPTREEPVRPVRFASQSPPARSAAPPASSAPAAHPHTSNRSTSEPEVSAVPAASSEVTLPAADCEVFALLSRVDAGVAQRFMMDAIQRARRGRHETTLPPPSSSGLNPEAAEFSVATQTATAANASGAVHVSTATSTSCNPPVTAAGTPCATTADNSRPNNCTHVPPTNPFIHAPRYPLPAPPLLFPPTPQYPMPMPPVHPYMFGPGPPFRGPVPHDPRQVSPDVRMFFANASAGIYGSVRPPPGFEGFY